MLTCGDSIRLTPNEKNYLKKLSGSDATGIKTSDQLQRFVESHMDLYCSNTPDEVLLRKMLANFLKSGLSKK